MTKERFVYLYACGQVLQDIDLDPATSIRGNQLFKSEDALRRRQSCHEECGVYRFKLVLDKVIQKPLPLQEICDRAIAREEAKFEKLESE